MATLLARGQITIAAIKDGKDGADGKDAVIYTLEASPSYIRLNSDGSIDYTNGYIDKGDEYESDKYLVVRGYKVVKGVRDNRFSTESSPRTIRLTINDGSAYSEYTPSDGDSVSIDFEPKYEDSYYSMLQEISNSGLNSVRVDMCEGSEYNTNKILATCDIPIIRNGKDGQKGDQGDKGEQGNKGDKGEDAVSILVEDAPLVFDTDDNGTVSSSVTKTAKVKVMKGNTNVTNDCTSELSRDDLSSNCMSSVKKDKDNECINVSVQGNWITKNDVIVDGVSHGKVSATSGYAVAQFVYAGVVYFAQVPFSVNVAKFTGVVAFDNKGYKSQFEEVSNRLNDTATKDELKKAESDFKQTAREISLSVSEKAMGRRNMLPGSALRKGDDGFEMSIYGDFDGSTYTKGYRGNQGIFMNGGVSGSNFFRVKSYYDGSEQQYGGLFWRGGGASKNIKVQANKKYVLSCWVKCDRTDVTIALETIYNASETTMTKPGRPSTTTNNFHVSKANTWQLISCIVTTDGSFNYVEVNFWVSHKINGVTATACFCHPMFEEAEEYNGWTLSKLDYDYIGGNLIDNSRTFASGGNCNVRTKYGSVIANGYNSESSVFKARMEALAGSVPSKYSLPSSASSGTRYALDSDWSVWQYNGNSLSDDSHYNGWQKTNESLHQDIMRVNLNLELNKDYIISWYAKCEGKGLFGAYAADVGKTVYSEYSDGGINQSTYGENIFLLTTQWKRFWMHVKLIKGSCSAIIFRQYRGDLSSGSSAMTVYFTQPKIEEGATVTDWTEKRTDMVDRQALLATGIDITNGKITITANNTIFRDNNGTTIALFANGKINASLIDVKHLWAISEDGTSKVGYFGNDTDSACIIDNNTTAPLFVGGSTALMSNFYVTSNGKMVAKDAEISGTLKGVSGTFNELTDGTGKLSIGFQDNGFFIKGYTRFYNDVTIGGMLRSQGKGANYLAVGVWARGTFGSNARLTLMCIDNHRYYYEGYDNTKRVQGSTLVSSDGAIEGHYPWLVSMRPVTSQLGMDDGEEDCEYYGASFDLVIIRTTSKSGYYKFTNCGYGKVFHVINGYDKQSVWIAYQGGWFELYGGMGITMAYLDSSMYTPTSTKAGAGFFILGTYDNTWV